MVALLNKKEEEGELQFGLMVQLREEFLGRSKMKRWA
jgi:hypothetical protein